MSSKKKQPAAWGSPEYLQERYDDIDTAWALSRKCVVTKAVKSAVAKIATKKDNLSVRDVIEITRKGPDVECNPTGYVALLDLGLNGKGRQADYFSCLSKVAKAGFYVFDAFIDACDDVGAVLVSFNRDTLVKKEVR